MAAMRIQSRIGPVEFIPPEMGRVELAEVDPREPVDFGFHLQDGVFCDLNGNVSLIPSRRTDPPLAQGTFWVVDHHDVVSVNQENETTRVEGPHSSALIVSQEQVVVAHPDYGQPPTVIVTQAGGWLIESAGSTVTIRQEDGRLVISGAEGSTVVEANEEGILVDAPGIENDFQVVGSEIVRRDGSSEKLGSPVFRGELGLLVGEDLYVSR